MPTDALGQLTALWSGRQLPVDPVAALRTVAEALARGELPPERERKHVAAALLAHLDGREPDLASALGLRSSRAGKPTPVRISERERRDAQVRHMASRLDGTVKARAGALARSLQGLEQIQAPELAQWAEQMLSDFPSMPTSSRHLERILASDTDG